jgi:hypothetical protein
MPRYYIDVRSHFATDEDPEGVELPDIAAAKAEALKMGARRLEDWAELPPAYSNAIVIEIIDAISIRFCLFLIQTSPCRSYRRANGTP